MPRGMTTNNIELEDRIRAAQVRSAYSNTAPGMTATAVAAFLVAGILAGVGAVSWPLAIAFSVFMLVQIQARLLLISAYHRHQPPDHEWRIWSRRFSIGVTIGSFGLGGFSLLLFPPRHFDMQLLLMLYLCAVASGAVTAFGVLRPAIYLSMLPMMLLPMAWMVAQGDWVHWVLTLITLGWLLAIADQARRYSAQFEESVRLRFENEELIARLRQEKSLAEDASSAKSRFLAAASHDLRQPVHALSLFVAALRPRVTDQRGAPACSITSTARCRPWEACSTGCSTSRGSMPAWSKSTRRASRSSRCSNASAATTPATRQAKQIELRLRPTRAAAFSDPLLVERIVRNIVANAIAYTDSGRVLVGCRRRGRSVLIEVWDTGRGIPTAEQARIFQEFYQVGNPERDRGRGVGLGLAIVKRLTALLGHPLKLRSQPERGSVFTLELPYSDAPLAAHARVCSTFRRPPTAEPAWYWWSTTKRPSRWP